MLGDIASVATLILFFIYFIGRIITLHMEKDMYYDEIAFVSIYDHNRYVIIDMIETVTVDGASEDASSLVVLTSKQGIRNVSVFALSYDDHLNEIKRKSKKIGHCDFLNVGQSYAIKTSIPELIPRYKIVYYTQDFKKVTLNISENLKSVVVSEMIQPTHTFNSLIYYLFR